MKEINIEVVPENTTPIEEETPKVEKIPHNQNSEENELFAEDVLLLINKSRADPEWLLKMLQSKENTRIGKGFSGQDTRRAATDVKSHPVSDRSELILD